MSNINDGGPAFPVSTSDPTGPAQDGYTTQQFPGMTLRDWFAGQALAGLSCNPRHDLGEPIWDIAYAFADAMIAARNTDKETTK